MSGKLLWRPVSPFKFAILKTGILKIKTLLPDPLVDVLSTIYTSRELRKWERAGRPLPPPDSRKRQILREHAQKYLTGLMVETGTYLGSMIFAQRKLFRKIYSVELSKELHQNAQKRFRKYSHIHLLHGNSGEVLEKLVPELAEPALFWLDGHYSGGITAMSDCPVEAELAAILKSPLHHVMLIDDARCFTGTSDYPSVEQIQSLVAASSKPYQVTVAEDIIRIVPA